MKTDIDPAIVALEKETKETIEKLSHHIAEKLIDAIPDKHFEITDKKHRKSQMEHTILKQLMETNTTIASGSKAMLERLFVRNKNKSKEELEAYSNDLKKLAVQHDPEKIVKMLENKKTFQEIFDISSKTLEELYQSAKDLYDHKMYYEASGAFSFLTLLVPENPLFWMGQASSCYLLRHYEQAIQLFLIAAYLNPYDPICHIYSSKCYEELHDKEHAIKLLELALFAIEEASDKEDLKSYIHQEIKRIQNKGK